jgi:hypothetical protein
MGLAWPTQSTMLRAEVLAAQGRPIKAGQLSEMLKG